MRFLDRFRTVSRYHFDKRMNAIMSQVSDFVEQLNTHFERQSVALQNVATDVTELKRLLEEASNNPGDAALITQALEKANALTTQLESVDQMHPPVPPVEPPAEPQPTQP